MGKRNIRPLLLGLILSIITILLLSLYLKDLGKEEVVIVSHSDVVVASKTIPNHTVVTGDMLEIVSIHDDAIHPDAIKSKDQVIGGISRGEIIGGEQILAVKVVSEGMKPNLAYQIPENMRAITVPLDEISGVANHIVIGDKVDILSTYNATNDLDGSVTHTQLQNIEVLELGVLRSKKVNDTEENQAIEQSGSITLLVTPQQAEIVAFATINGRIHLTLRNPADKNKVKLNHYSFDNFNTYKERWLDGKY